MKTLALHIDCLREVERCHRKLSRGEALGMIAGATLTALAVGGAYLLEQVVLERLGIT